NHQGRIFSGRRPTCARSSSVPRCETERKGETNASGIETFTRYSDEYGDSVFHISTSFANSHSRPPHDRLLLTQSPASVPTQSQSATHSEMRRGRVSVPRAVATGSRGYSSRDPADMRKVAS